VTYERCLNPACRRELTDPASRLRGYGPKCWEARQPQPIGAILRQLPIARRAAGHVPGQLALDLETPRGDDTAGGAA
jgi:hypothetical protein